MPPRTAKAGPPPRSSRRLLPAHTDDDGDSAVDAAPRPTQPSTPKRRMRIVGDALDFQPTDLGLGDAGNVGPPQPTPCELWQSPEKLARVPQQPQRSSILAWAESVIPVGSNLPPTPTHSASALVTTPPEHPHAELCFAVHAVASALPERQEEQAKAPSVYSVLSSGSERQCGSSLGHPSQRRSPCGSPPKLSVALGHPSVPAQLSTSFVATSQDVSPPPKPQAFELRAGQLRDDESMARSAISGEEHAAFENITDLWERAKGHRQHGRHTFRRCTVWSGYGAAPRCCDGCFGDIKAIGTSAAMPGEPLYLHCTGKRCGMDLCCLCARVYDARMSTVSFGGSQHSVDAAQERRSSTGAGATAATQSQHHEVNDGHRPFLSTVNAHLGDPSRPQVQPRTRAMQRPTITSVTPRLNSSDRPRVTAARSIPAPCPDDDDDACPHDDDGSSDAATLVLSEASCGPRASKRSRDEPVVDSAASTGHLERELPHRGRRLEGSSPLCRPTAAAPKTSAEEGRGGERWGSCDTEMELLGVAFYSARSSVMRFSQ